MNRKDFIGSFLATFGMMSLTSLKTLANSLRESEILMPVLFIGHGSPMNGIEDNDFSRRWAAMGKSIPRPKAVICISAHWLTSGTHITAMTHPRTIYDFGGFPEALYQVKYPAPGDPVLAAETTRIVTSTDVGLNHDWGLDHGTWTIVRHMYPAADIPVLQLSIDYHKPAQYHYALAGELAALRKKGVLLIGSGNIVHNLRMVAFDKIGETNHGFDWAFDFDKKVKDSVSAWDHKKLINYRDMGESARLAVPTPDHYYPLLYTLGLATKGEPIVYFNDVAVGGSITMTSLRIG